MEHIHDILNFFKQSESDLANDLRKIKCAQSIVRALGKLKVDAKKVRDNVECEIAVMQTQQLINGE